MSTIREELERLGPEAVARGMVAFEHRVDGRSYRQVNCERWVCCFVSHALPTVAMYEAVAEARTVEAAFEGRFGPGLPQREDLRQECIAFLAEHGKAKEPQTAVEAVQA